MTPLGSWIYGSEAKERDQGWRYRTGSHGHSRSGEITEAVISEEPGSCSSSGRARGRTEKEAKERRPEKREENQEGRESQTQGKSLLEKSTGPQIGCFKN